MPTYSRYSPVGGGTSYTFTGVLPITVTEVLGTVTTSMTQADATTDGWLSAADWSNFDSKQSALTFGNLTELTSSVLTISGGTGAVIGSGTTIQVLQSGAAQDGYLSSADWNTFNSKQNALSFGNLSETGSSILTITGGTNAVIGSGTTIQVSQAGASTNGFLSSTDWNTFNNKQPAGTYVTSVSGTAPVSSSGGTTPAISISQSGAATDGYLSSTDWNTFNNKASYPAFSDDRVLYSTNAGAEWRIVGTGSTTAAYPANTVIVGRAKPTGLTGTGNIIVGSGAGTNQTSGTNNVIIGLNAANNSNGSNQVAIGSSAVVGASGYIAIGASANANAVFGIAIGNSSSVTATGGIAIGGSSAAGLDSAALGLNASSNTDCVAVGHSAASASNGAISIGRTAKASGINTIAIGKSAGRAAATGANNILVGNAAGNALTTGSANICIGQDAGGALTSSGQNVIIGHQAGVTGSTNMISCVAVGMSTLNQANGLYNTAVGWSAAQYVTGEALTFVGALAGQGVNGGTNTGNNNTLIGTSAGRYISTGSDNSLIGQNCGVGVNTGNTYSQNVFFGSNAAEHATTASNCVFVGFSSGRGNTANKVTGNFNSALGSLSLNAITTGTGNIAIGYSAGDAITTGSNNVIIGDIAGSAALADTMIFAAGTAERFRVDSSGNMGIGTNTPGHLLEVAGNAKVNSALLTGSTSGTITLSAADTTTSYAVKWPSAQGASTTVLQNDGSGNLSWVSGLSLPTQTGNSGKFLVTDGSNTSWDTVVNDSGADLDFRVEGDTDSNLLFTDASTDRVGVGTNAPNTKLEVQQETATTNAVTNVLRINSQSSGTPANGIGVGIEFAAETAASNTEVGATIEAITTDVTSASEDFDLSFKTMAAGAAAAERMRVTSTGDFKFDSGYGSVETAYGCRAWVNFDGTSTVTIREDGNVSSITDNGTGDYTINFTTSMPDANYATNVSCSPNYGGAYAASPAINATAVTEIAPTTSATRFTVASTGGSVFDSKYLNVCIFR